MAENVIFQAGMDDHDDVWDDSLMIQQYDEAMEMVKRKVAHRIENKDKETNNIQQNGGESSTTEDKTSGCINKKKKNKSKKKPIQWKEGDFCRCLFDEDGEIYEATITELTEDGAVVNFLGYDDTQVVYLSSLSRSLGAKARKRQMRDALWQEEEESCVESTNDTQTEEGEWHPQQEEDNSNGSSDPHTNFYSYPSDNPQSRQRYQPQPPPAYPQHPYAYYDPHQPSAMQYPQAPPIHHPQAPPIHYPQAPPTHYPQGSSSHPMPDFLPPPPPPPGLPLENPLLHTLLMSWYMTGYHTGYYKAANSNKKDKKKR